MHHRSQEGLQIDPDLEEYTAVDQPLNKYEAAVWQAAQERYGDSVQLVHGDRAALDLPDNSIDELIALGSYSQKAEEAKEFDRVLVKGGLLRLGVGAIHLPVIERTWGVKLEELGYTRVAEETIQYEYFPASFPEGMDLSYVVVTYKKSEKDNTSKIEVREVENGYVVVFSSLDQATEFVSEFWAAMPHHQDFFPTDSMPDWTEELTAGDRTKISQGTSPALKGKWLARITGNHQPLTAEAVAWIQQRTK